MRGETRFLSAIAGVLFLSGCASTSRNGIRADLEYMNQRLNTAERNIAYTNEQVKQLGKEVGTLSHEIEDIRTGQQTTGGTADNMPPTGRKKAGAAIPSLSMEQIQKALRNTGYYTGPIDGKAGRKTKEAIKAFQKDHSLKADGIVGIKTNEALLQYLTVK